MRGPILTLAALLAGCASAEQARMAEAEAEFERRYMSCDIEAAQDFVGRVPDTAMLAALRKAAKATGVRIAPPPGAPMSQEGVPGRLTVTLDGEGRIAFLACE